MGLNHGLEHGKWKKVGQKLIFGSDFFCSRGVCGVFSACRLQARSACQRRRAPQARDVFDHPHGYVPRFGAGAAPKARALRTSAAGASVFDHPQGNFYRVSEASEDGSKRPERSEGRLRSPVGANTMYSMTLRGFRAPQARV